MTAGGVDTGRITHHPMMHRDDPWKEPVRVATTANGTFSTAFDNGSSIDGISLVTGDRILIKNQSAGEQNGIYIVQASGDPLRAYDLDNDSEAVGAMVRVRVGTANGGKLFACTNTTDPVLDTDAITFTEFSSGASAHSGLTGLTTGDDHTQYVENADDIAVAFTVGDGVNNIATGIFAAIRMPFTGHIRGNSVLSTKDVTGSIQFDIWKDTHANAPPTVADTITASAKPLISSAKKSEDNTLTGWTTSFTVGDWMVFNVDSASSLTMATLVLYLDRT